MKILVTGGAGYVGSVLIEELLSRQHDVICLDRFFFGIEHMKKISDSHPNLTLVKDDIRWFDPHILDDVDVAFDLAAISDDPKGELDPFYTYDINHLGRARVARLSKMHGVSRYVLASSMSVYGFQSKVVNENSSSDPISTYAKSHSLAEKDIICLTDEDFATTALRFSTIYGLSPRMRFDLAVNSMALNIHERGRIPLRGGGLQWRPFVHIRDAATAYIIAMEHSKDAIAGEIFNVGSNTENYQIVALAKMIGDAIGLPYKLEEYGNIDKRSYIGNFDKISNVLRFKPKFTPKDGALEVYNGLKNNIVIDTPVTRTIPWYNYLLRSRQLNLGRMIEGEVN